MSTNWPMVALGDISKPKQWPTLSKKNLISEGFPVFGANGIIGFSAEKTHDSDTILIACRGTCGQVNIGRGAFYANGNAMALDSLDDERVDLEFLARFLAFRGLRDVTTGSSQPQITRENLVRVEVPLPNLAEQHRIAAILNEAEELRGKRQKTLGLLDENRSSVIREFLIADAAGSDSVCIRDVSNLVTKGTTPTSLGLEYTSEGVPFLRVQDLTDNSLENSPSVLFVSDKTHEVLSRSKIFSGDVLISIAGTIGRTAVVPENSGEMNCNQAVAIIRPNERILPEYLCSWLESPEAKRQIGLESVTATIANLSLGVLSNLKLPLPPMSRQLDLVRRLDEFKRVRAQMLKSMELFDELVESLQDRAFKGEL